MKSEKQQLQKNKELKTKKKILPKPKETKLENPAINSMNYFRIIKELEKQNSNQKYSEELRKKNPKQKQRNINELIYSKNSKKLGNYYNKNQNDLLLYGSSKYDVLPMDNLLKEMGQYKSKVINKINENKNHKNSKKNSEINELIEEYDNCNNKVILTPLAETEKDLSEMETLEKANFDEAKRLGVVMRRIEYTYLLNNRNNINKNGENKEMISKLKSSVDKIERCWLRHRRRKIEKMKNNAKRGHIEIEYLSSNDNIKKIENLEKKCEKLNKELEEEKKIVEQLDSENKQLKILLDDSTKKEEYNSINTKYIEKMNELKTLNQNHNDLLLEKNSLQEKYDKLLEEKNTLNDKCNEISDKLNKQNEELNKIKNEYEAILKQNNEKEEKIKELEKDLDNVNKEKINFENDNKLLNDKITNLDGEFNNFKKTKTFQDSENENKLKSLEENYNKEKEELNKNINEYRL